MSDDIKRAIKELIEREGAPGRSFGDDESLLETGVLDSMLMTKLLAFIEQRFEVVVEGDEREDPDNFESLAAITALVQRKKGA